MGLLYDISSEFRYNFGNWKRAIPIIAIFLIPILYAGTFLWAFWDPYGHLNRMPVAVVNEDTGAIYQGKPVAAGRELVGRLRTNTAFDWHFVTASQAKTGLMNNQYFMEIEIPPDFSRLATEAATNASVPRPDIVAITNERHNYIASIIGQTALEKIKEQTAQQLTRTYTDNLVLAISQLGQGYRSASAGAAQVATGASQLQGNTEQLVGGAQSVANGSKSLADGLSRVTTGSVQLSSGATRLVQGSAGLNTGLNQLVIDANQLGQAALQERQGMDLYVQQLQQSATGAARTDAGANQVASGLQQYEKLHPELARDPQFQALLVGSEQVAAESHQLASGQQQLLQGANRLQQGQTQFSAGFTQFQSGLLRAEQGSHTLVAEQPQLVRGSQQLVEGLSRLSQGANRLAVGTEHLSQGINQFATGVSDLNQGSHTLASRLSQASQTVPILNQNQLASTASNPVGLTVEKAGDVGNYGQGFAPYFLSLGLFVGALLMSIVIAFRDPADKPTSGLTWFASKFALIGLVGVIQSLIADLVLLKGLGLHVPNVTQFVLFSLLTSITFVSLVQFFVSSMANPGRYLVVILLILQLTSSSGTYPVILSPAFFQHLYAYLPMTYSVDGFRYLIGGGNEAFFSADIWHLVAFCASFVALSVAYFWVSYRRAYRGGTDAAGKHEASLAAVH